MMKNFFRFFLLTLSIATSTVIISAMEGDHLPESTKDPFSLTHVLDNKTKGWLIEGHQDFLRNIKDSRTTAQCYLTSPLEGLEGLEGLKKKAKKLVYFINKCLTDFASTPETIGQIEAVISAQKHIKTSLRGLLEALRHSAAHLLNQKDS